MILISSIFKGLSLERKIFNVISGVQHCFKFYIKTKNMLVLFPYETKYSRMDQVRFVEDSL